MGKVSILLLIPKQHFPTGQEMAMNRSKGHRKYRRPLTNRIRGLGIYWLYPYKA